MNKTGGKLIIKIYSTNNGVFCFPFKIVSYQLRISPNNLTNFLCSDIKIIPFFCSTIVNRGNIQCAITSFHFNFSSLEIICIKIIYITNDDILSCLIVLSTII